MMTVQSDNIGASAWLDNKVVMVMYSGFNPLATSTVLRKQKNGSRLSFPCPLAIDSYNKYMGGVDRGDQLRGYYASKIKSRKYYKYISNFLVGVSLVNAFILFRIGHPGSKTDLKDFQELLAKQLIGDYCSKRRPGRVGHRIAPLSLQHYPSKIPSDHRKRGRCSLCQEKHKRRDTQWFCRECEVWLCHPGTDDDCFLLWHRRRVQ